MTTTPAACSTKITSIGPTMNEMLAAIEAAEALAHGSVACTGSSLKKTQDTISNENRVDQLRDATYQSLEELTADILAQLKIIEETGDKIADDEGKIKELNSEPSAGGGLTPDSQYLNSLQNQGKKTVADYKNNEAEQQAKQKAAINKLASDLKSFQGETLENVQKLLDSLTSQLKADLKSLNGPNAKPGEASAQKATSVVAEAAGILQMILSKFNQMKSDEQQWMSRARIVNSEIAEHTSEVNTKVTQKITEAQLRAQAAGKIFQDITIALSLLVSVFDPITFAMACIYATLQLTGALDSLTQKLANAIDPTHHSIWAQVLANLIVSAVFVIIEAAPTLAKTMINRAIDIAGRTAVALAEGIGESTTEVASTFTETAGEQSPILSRLKAIANSTAGKTIGWTLCKLTLYFAMNQGFMNLVTLLYAASKKETEKSQEQLQQEEGALMLILGVCLSMVAMGASAKLTPDTGSGSTLQIMKSTTAEDGMFSKGLGKMIANQPLIENGFNALKAFVQAVQTDQSITSGQLTQMKAKLTLLQSMAEATLDATNATGRSAKLYEQKQIELFATMLSEGNTEQVMLNQHALKGELEAARALNVSAV